MSRWGDAESGYADSAYYSEDRGDVTPQNQVGVFRPTGHLWVVRDGENGPITHQFFGGKFVNNGFLLELIFTSADCRLAEVNKINTMGRREPMDVTAFPAVQVNFGKGQRDVFQRGNVWKYEIDSVVFAEDVSHLRWI